MSFFEMEDLVETRVCELCDSSIARTSGCILSHAATYHYSYHGGREYKRHVHINMKTEGFLYLWPQWHPSMSGAKSDSGCGTKGMEQYQAIFLLVSRDEDSVLRVGQCVTSPLLAFGRPIRRSFACACARVTIRYQVYYYGGP